MSEKEEEVSRASQRRQHESHSNFMAKLKAGKGNITAQYSSGANEPGWKISGDIFVSGLADLGYICGKPKMRVARPW